MTTFTIFMLVIIPMCWVAWQIWRARRAILTTAKQQADLMDPMPITEAARFALLGQTKHRAPTQPLPTTPTDE